MRKKNKKPLRRKIVLRLPDLDHAKNSSSEHAEFAKFEAELQVRNGAIHHLVLFRTATGSEPSRGPEISTVSEVSGAGGRHHQPEARRRRLAYEAADSGLLSPELATGIRRVKGVKQLGSRAGNWLTRDQARLLLEESDGESLRCTRDVAMISILLGCELRRAELVSLRKEDVQIRQGHWAIVDLVGKGGHVRTIPVPAWIKNAVDRWMAAAGVTDGRVFRAVSPHGSAWGKGVSETWFGMWFGTVLSECSLIISCRTT